MWSKEGICYFLLYYIRWNFTRESSNPQAMSQMFINYYHHIILNFVSLKNYFFEKKGLLLLLKNDGLIGGGIMNPIENIKISYLV